MTRHLTAKVIHKRATEAVQMRRKVTEIAKRPAVNLPGENLARDTTCFAQCCERWNL